MLWGVMGPILGKTGKIRNFTETIFTKKMLAFQEEKSVVCTTSFELKGTIFENKYVQCWNTQSVTLMREAVLYWLQSLINYLR